MAKVRITQVRSTIDRPESQKLTIKALGLGKIDKSVEVEFTPQIKGMVNKVSHLVNVTELK
ncbi:MAG: 50S ribosomal protein L30 [Cytophagaceae bacterium]